MTIEEFERALNCGLGRCVTELKACENKEVYRAAVLDCCLNNPCFDTQCEGTRAEYIYDLVSAFGDAEYFLLPVIDKLNNSLDDCGWDFAHLCDLTAEFARRGNEKALAALKGIYGELYAVLLKRRDFDGYDGERDNFERLCTVFSELYGLPAFIKMASDIGELFIANDRYDGSDFEWFYIHFSNIVGKENLKKHMLEESERSPSVRAFYNEILKVIAPPPVRSSLPKKRKSKKCKVVPVDVQLLFNRLNSLEIDRDNESGWHGAVIDILDAFDNGLEVPGDALMLVYEKSLCSCCREDAVWDLNKCGWLTDEMKEECLFDSNADIREYAKKILN